MTLVSLDTHRREKIGGSEAAAACGIDPFRSRLMLWYEKVNGIERDESEAMRLGTLLWNLGMEGRMGNFGRTGNPELDDVLARCERITDELETVIETLDGREMAVTADFFRDALDRISSGVGMVKA